MGVKLKDNPAECKFAREQAEQNIFKKTVGIIVKNYPNKCKLKLNIVAKALLDKRLIFRAFVREIQK
ncbi:MAG: hypothetical protein PHC94_00220 [Methylobacter sp.]|nr:hypothetical protein [Methylococcales bacterium]MDD5112392.1 hypothetical protein [Methylobacter sp.]MDD5112420.1 hypothetical protein [Methylobacter sp.]